MTQAQGVAARLRSLGVDVDIVEVVTQGDRDQTTPLASLGGVGIFAVEVQRAVLAGDADVAVHSAKDLPSITPDGLFLACVPERRDPADVLVGRSLAGLGPGATVATGSPRRRALLAERRPDLNFVELRGNMATRLAAVASRGVDAVVAAAAALDRLGVLDQVAERLDPTWCVPQVGQGALALETRADDVATQSVLAALHDDIAAGAVTAERAFLAELGAGCSIPAAAHARRVDDTWELTGVLAALDGSRVVRSTERGDDPRTLGVAIARRVRDDLGGGALAGLRP
jgi:hydroxymethylbilane synthase